MSDLIARANARHALELIRAGRMSREKAEETLIAMVQSGIDLEELTEEMYGKSWPPNSYEDDDPYEDW